MALSFSEKVLKQSLSSAKLNNYFVMEFCNTAGISRPYFYRQYKNMTDLYTSVLVLQLRRALRDSAKKPIDRLIYDMLKEMLENKIFYINIYNTIRDSKKLYGVLKKEIEKLLESYMRPRGAFSVRNIELVAEGIYAVLYHWVANDFREDIRDIYQCLNLFLPTLEKYLNK